MAAAAVDTAAAHRVHWLRMIEVFRAEKDVKAAAKASHKTCHACIHDARVDAIRRNDDALTLVNARAFVCCCVQVVELRSRPAADAHADDAVVALTEAEADAPAADVYALTRHPSDAHGNTPDDADGGIVIRPAADALAEAAADAPADEAADAPADDPADAPSHADGGCYSCPEADAAADTTADAHADGDCYSAPEADAHGDAPAAPTPTPTATSPADSHDEDIHSDDEREFFEHVVGAVLASFGARVLPMLGEIRAWTNDEKTCITEPLIKNTSVMF